MSFTYCRFTVFPSGGVVGQLISVRGTELAWQHFPSWEAFFASAREWGSREFLNCPWFVEVGD